MLSYKPQDFSMPDSLIYLITKNPSNPEFYQKLIKTCKYFFAKNPILVIHCLQFDDNGWSKCYDCKDEKYSIYESQWETYGDFEKSFSKIWITSQISIRPNDIDKDYIAAGINRRLYQCDTKSSDFLILQNQELVLKELFSYSKFKTVDIKDVSVKCENNLEAPLETIFNIFNKIINFDFTFDDEKKCSTKTVENLLKIPHFSSTYAIILRNIPDSFNIDKFYEYLKKNRNMFVILWFNDTISEKFCNRLKEITNELFEVPTDSDKYIPLAIGYPGNELAKVEHVFDNLIKWNENSNVLYELLLQR